MDFSVNNYCECVKNPFYRNTYLLLNANLYSSFTLYMNCVYSRELYSNLSAKETRT